MPHNLGIKKSTFRPISDQSILSDMVYYPVESKVSGVSEATDVTNRWIHILISVTKGDFGGTGINNL